MSLPKTYKVLLQYNHQLVTHITKAVWKDDAILSAKKSAVQKIDPQNRVWPPVMQQLRLMEVVTL